MTDKCSFTPELKKTLPYQKTFKVPKNFPAESFRGWVIERVFCKEKTPTGCWFPIIDYIKFDDGSHALRFWYQGVENGKIKTARGIFLRENDIKSLKKEIDKTFAIKALIKRFIE